jgi:acyl-CoA thioesterase FadM
VTGEGAPAVFSYSHRVRPQECTAAPVLGHPRLFEIFEAAFIETWRSRLGPLDESLGCGRRLTLAALTATYQRQIPVDSELQIDVCFETLGRSSFAVRYIARLKGDVAAEGHSTYVCIDAPTGSSVELPDSVVQAIAAALTRGPGAEP